MKKIILLLTVIFIFSEISILYSDEYGKYKNAFNYISGDTVFLSKMFHKAIDFDTLPGICVSNQIVYISNLFFIDSLYLYENGKQKYQMVDAWQKDSISNVMDSLLYYESYIDTNLTKVFYNKCDGLIIFFSKLENDKLKAKVFLYKNGVFDYKLTSRNSLNHATYLFYFKRDKIKKVFKTEFII